MSRETEPWRLLEHIAEVADRLVAEGFVEDEDREKCGELLVKMLEAWGYLPRHTVARTENRSAWSRAEQRRIVDAYIEFARTTNDPRKRSAKILSLGVSPETMCHWARKIYKPKTLQNIGPMTTIEYLLGYLRDHPWRTRAEIRRDTGIPDKSLPSYLSRDWGLKHLQRRKRPDGLWEYACRNP